MVWTEYLKNAIAKNRVAHAYLFVGGDNEEMRKTALDFAKSLNCANNEPPCNSCESCSSIDKGMHPDIRLTIPDERTGSIKIERIREIRDRVALKPYQGRTKVEIIINSDGMTQEAQNAFLKVLEEPPQDTVLILLAANRESLLLTIRSRCQILKFGYTDGRMPPHLSPLPLGERECLPAEALAKAGVRGKRDELLSSGLEGLEDSPRVEQEKTLKLLCGIYRDALMLKSKVKRELLLNVDRTEKIKEIADKLSHDDIESIIEEIEHSFQYLRQNVSPKLVFMALEDKLKCSR